MHSAFVCALTIGGETLLRGQPSKTLDEIVASVGQVLLGERKFVWRQHVGHLCWRICLVWERQHFAHAIAGGSGFSYRRVQFTN